MEKLASIRRRPILARSSVESGQTMIFVVVGLAVVLLAIVGFAVDYGNIWFRRQHAQSAADAVCTAAVMDMLNSVSLGVTSTGGVTTGTDFDCTSSGAPTSSPCRYAALNGYNGAGLSAGTESNHVAITFPTSLTGNPIPVCPNPIPASMKVCIPPSSMTTNPFVQVEITSRLKATFFGLLTANNTVDVPAKASCGVVLASAPIPLLVLDPTRANTVINNGTAGISIYGGPQRSIQVNSSNASAVNPNGNVQIDLTQGGPNVPPTGSDFGVVGIQSPALQTDRTTPLSGCSKYLCIGSTGNYSPGVRPINDPFALTNAPSKTLMAAGVKSTVVSPNHGCPALPAGTSCDEYTPGYYPSPGISVINKYAIFQPGIYYVEGGITFGNNACIRPSTQDGDGSGGTFFYLADNNSINVTSNSGCNRNPQTVATNFDTATGGPTGFNFGAACDSVSLAASPTNLPATMSGSVLLAPCLGPVTNCAPNCSINGGRGYGDPLGSASHPGGIARGLLFMQNRNQTSPAAPQIQGGGAFLMSGSMYFHQCKTTGTTDTGGTGCPTSAYQDQLQLGGNSASNSYILGDIVVDQLQLKGTPNIYMDLSPNSLYFIYKASLLQ